MVMMVMLNFAGLAAVPLIVVYFYCQQEAVFFLIVWGEIKA